jgi:predicted aldo/keto reductase-like oxidoreductase
MFHYSELALRWILQYPVSTVFSGMWHKSEVDQNTAVLRNPVPLTEPEKLWLSEAKYIIDKQYCRLDYQCAPCPEEIAYVSILSLPMYYHRDGLDRLVSVRKDRIQKTLESVDACTQCNECVKSCPHDLPIPDLIREFRFQYYETIANYKG